MWVGQPAQTRRVGLQCCQTCSALEHGMRAGRKLPMFGHFFRNEARPYEIWIVDYTHRRGVRAVRF